MKKNRFTEEQIIRILKEAEQGDKEIRELRAGQAADLNLRPHLVQPYLPPQLFATP